MEEELTEEQLRERQERRRRRKEERLRHVRRMRALCCFFVLAVCVITGSVAAAARSRTVKKAETKRIELASIEAERVKAASEAQAEVEAAEEEAAKKKSEDLPDVGAIYGIYVKDRGWSHFFADNSYCMAPAGNSVTAIRATLHNQPEGMTGTITYRVNLSGSGWLDWQEDGSDGGRIDQDMPLEAICIQLTGEMGEYYDILYSVLQNEAWTDWVMNGEEAGASGVGLHIDGLRISVVKKQEGKTSYAGGIDPEKPMIALTYDDGPSFTETPRILEALKAVGGRATFFMVGKQVERNGDIVKQMVEQGCEVGNHTYDHTLMTKVEPMVLAEQLARTNQVVSDSSGISPVLMRPCGGARCDAGMDVVGAVSMPAILWSIDTLDWKTRDAQNTIQTVLEQVQDGDIILMHDLYDATAAASETLIPELVNQGYQLVTVSELASYRGGMLPGKVYSRFRPN